MKKEVSAEAVAEEVIEAEVTEVAEAVEAKEEEEVWTINDSEVVFQCQSTRQTNLSFNSNSTLLKVTLCLNRCSSMGISSLARSPTTSHIKDSSKRHINSNSTNSNSSNTMAILSKCNINSSR